MKHNLVNVMGMAVCGLACILLVMVSVPGRVLAEGETLITIKSGLTFNSLAGKDCTEINFHTDYEEPLPQGTAYDVDDAGTIVGVRTGTVLDIYCRDGIALDADCFRMFYEMTELTSIGGLNKIDTSNVTDMYEMFSDCISMEIIDVSGFDTSKVKSMSCMFSISEDNRENSKVKGIIFGDKFDTSNVTEMCAMFQGATVEELDVSGFNTAKVTDMMNMFSNCTLLKELDVSGFDTSKVCYMRGMFSGCESLTALDLSGFDTSNATDMCGMFFSCHSLADVDLSGFDTSKVTITNAMFCDCLSMKTIDVSSFDMSKVKDMGWMFGTNSEYAEDTHLEKVILGTISAPAAYTVMHCMFYGDTKLTDIVFDGFDTSKVTNMSAMFCDCKSITGIDLSEFNTANVTDMSYMFAGCESLKKLNLTACDVSKVEDMSGMFINCYNLEVLDISTWKTPALTLMSSKIEPADIEYSADGSLYEGMFEHCRALKTLDLSGFDTSKVTEASESFNDCPNLKTVKTGAGWTLSGILPTTPATGDDGGSPAVYVLALAASLAAAGISIGIVIRFNKICYAEK